MSKRGRLHRRHESEDDAGDDRDAEREPQDGAVDADVDRRAAAPSSSAPAATTPQLATRTPATPPTQASTMLSTTS